MAPTGVPNAVAVPARPVGGLRVLGDVVVGATPSVRRVPVEGPRAVAAPRTGRPVPGRVGGVPTRVVTPEAGPPTKVTAIHDTRGRPLALVQADVGDGALRPVPETGHGPDRPGGDIPSDGVLPVVDPLAGKVVASPFHVVHAGDTVTDGDVTVAVLARRDAATDAVPTLGETARPGTALANVVHT